MIKPFFLFVFFLLFITACNNHKNQQTLVIFHAGSLAKPIGEIIKQFKAVNPHVKILTESSGSIECARKVTDLKKKADLILVSDYQIIDQMLIPEYASWSIGFASSSMVIAYHHHSAKLTEIDSVNWFEILATDDIRFGRSNPNTDPCGYRTDIMFQLAEKYYKQAGLAYTLINKDKIFIRPKEVDLLALLETGMVDYLIIYESVALQHQLNYINLPQQINLGNLSYSDYYACVCTQITGINPQQKREICGHAIIYGLTIPKNAPNKELAVAFATYLLGPEKGLYVIADNGMNTIKPFVCNGSDSIPEDLIKYCNQQ